MITLTSLAQLENDTYYAKWFDSDDATGIGHTFAAIHDENGRSQAANFGLRPPRLTAEQMAEAQPVAVDPIDALLEKLTTARPDLANVGKKAARLVRDGRVRLLADDRATVAGDSDRYTVTGHADKCGCKYGQFNGDWCSHRMAVRMARALQQPIAPMTEAEKEAASEANARANREWQAARNAKLHNALVQDEADSRRWCQTAEGARRYVNKALGNGAASMAAGSKLHFKWQQVKAAEVAAVEAA